MRCKWCKKEVRAINDPEAPRSPLYVHEEYGEEMWGCENNPRRGSEFPYHIPQFKEAPNFWIPEFTRHFLAAACSFCDAPFEVEYTVTRGLGGRLPEKDAAEHIRDEWMMNHVLDKHPERAK